MKTQTTKRDRVALEKRRLEAGELFKQDKNQRFVALKFNVTPAAVCQWHKAWKKKGQKGLNSKGPTGSDPKLDAKKKMKLKKLIMEGPKKFGYQTDFWTLSRIRDLAKRKLRITLGAGTVWRTVIDLGFSCQKPERRAKERDEQAITDWKLKEFPKLKKMGAET